MNIETFHNGLIDRTIKAHIKYFNLKIKNGFLYKNETAIYTEDLTNKDRLLAFLEGLSIAIDSKELFGLREK